jgi:hypothetical protein
MKYWYFKFEGEFRKDSSEFGGMGVFSSCLVPESNLRIAKSLFFTALRGCEIDLVDVIEQFTIDGNELDPRDERNGFWIAWYNEVKAKGELLFDPWHVFDK